MCSKKGGGTRLQYSCVFRISLIRIFDSYFFFEFRRYVVNLAFNGCNLVIQSLVYVVVQV